MPVSMVLDRVPRFSALMIQVVVKPASGKLTPNIPKSPVSSNFILNKADWSPTAGIVYLGYTVP
jgi:hypothetical protein